ncbi:MAG: AraC family transcriptional regulator [Pirellulales bacterium]
MTTDMTRFLQQLSPSFTGEELFDQLSDVVYFLKDAQGAYLVVNNTLVARCQVRDKRALIGKRASEVLRPPLGQQFEEQDRQVLRTGRPLISQLELHFHPDGQTGWCLTTKLPLRDKAGAIVGLVGVSQDLRLPQREGREWEQVARAVKDAESRLAERPSVPELATVARMSVYQLDRRMRSVFGLSTGQWLAKLRIDAARQLLRTTRDSVAAIALAAGYSDQSAFTRHFRKSTGLTPTEYRMWPP